MPKPTPSRHTTSADTTEAVDELMASLEHPAKKEIQALRRLVLGAHPSIAEGVKWNAPSFRTHEYFATMHLRAKKGVVLVLHFGAKAREVGAVRQSIQDPAGLLKWVAGDRATVTFESLSDVRAKTAPCRAILEQWITYV